MKLHEHGGQIKKWKREIGISNDIEILDFSANINPLGPPENVVYKIKEEFNNIFNYPEPQAFELCKELATHHGVKPENVLAGNGASELIDLFFLKQPPAAKVLLPAPTFSEYERAAVAAGGEIDLFCIGEESLSFHMEDFIKRIEDTSPDVVVICTPNNPTGELLEDYEVNKIVQAVIGVNGWLLIDKSFMPFARRDWYKLEWERLPQNVAVIYSFTKIYALAGLRLGYMLASENLIDKIKAARNPWSVNHLAQVGGKACIKEKKYEEKTRKLIADEREKLLKGLQELNLKPIHGAANYLLVRIEAGKFNSYNLWQELAKRGIFIRMAKNFHSLDQRYFRVAVRLPWENNKLLAQLEAIL